MNLSVNPKEFQSMKLRTPAEQTKFLFKLTQILSEMSSGITAIQGKISGLTPFIQDYGTITTNRTAQINGSLFVYISLASAVTQTRTLTLTGLPQGAVVVIFPVVTANTLTFKIQGTDQNGNAYTVQGLTSESGAALNYSSTGVAYTQNGIIVGMSGFIGSATSPNLQVLAT